MAEHLDRAPAPVQPSRPARHTWHPWPAWVDGVVAACVSLLIGVVRVRDHVPFWRDEVVTASLVDRPFSGFIDIITTQEAGMGPYYLALWLWTRLGTSDDWIRMFSVLGAAATVLLCHRVALRWFGRATAIVAAIVLMLHPTLLRYQTEARAYSWIMACVLGIVLAAMRLRRLRTTGAAALLGLVIGLGVALHVLVLVFVAIAIAVGWWCDTDRGWWVDRRFLACPLVAAAVLAPFTWPLLTSADQINWIPEPTLGEVRRVTTELLGGTRSTAVIAIGVLILVGSVAAVRARRRDPRFIAPPALALIPIASVAVVSLTVKPLFLARYMVAAVPFAVLAAVAGFALVRLGRRPIGLAAVAVLSIAVFAVRDPLDDEARPDDMKAATEYLTENVADGDVVLFDPVVTRTWVQWYGGVDAGADVASPGVQDDHLFASDRTDPAVAAAVREARRVWIVGRPEEADDIGAVSQLRQELDRLTTISTTVVGGLTFELLGDDRA